MTKSGARYYSDIELAPLLETIANVEPLLSAEIEKRSNELATIPKFTGELDLRMNRYVSKLADDFEGKVSENSDETRLDWLRDNAIGLATEDDESEFTPEEIRYAVELALSVTHRDKKEDMFRRLKAVQFEFEAIRFQSKAVMPDSQINLLRQGFILLMTAFDAAIFDLMRDALDRNFFELIPLMGKAAKFELKEFNHFADFGEFSSHIVEQQLKDRYIKDLLRFLVEIVDKQGGYHFAQLMELVQRRNVHVHNRGFVDSKYLELENGKPKWNIEGFKPGEVAAISDDYWQRANALCSFCVNAVAEWVGLGAKLPGGKARK